MHSFLTKYELSKLTKASRKPNNTITKVKKKGKKIKADAKDLHPQNRHYKKLRQFVKSSNKQTIPKHRKV